MLQQRQPGARRCSSTAWWHWRLRIVAGGLYACIALERQRSRLSGVSSVLSAPLDLIGSRSDGKERQRVVLVPHLILWLQRCGTVQRHP